MPRNNRNRNDAKARRQPSGAGREAWEGLSPLASDRTNSADTLISRSVREEIGVVLSPGVCGRPVCSPRSSAPCPSCLSQQEAVLRRPALLAREGPVCPVDALL